LNEPKKTVLALGIVMVLIGIAYVIEVIRDSGKGFLGLVIAGIVVLAILLGIHFAHARDDGRYANSPLKPWFDSLKSKGGAPCCSDADGTAVSDPDWESKDGHYRVRLDGNWIDVPDDAVITEPNRYGQTMVWPMRSNGWNGAMGLQIYIRCFMPGSMT
jgi:hypothetical protein